MPDGHCRKSPRTRYDFSRIPTRIKVPNLIEVKKRSYERFLQMFTAPRDREKTSGLQAVFKSIFPIEDFRETCSLDFVNYSIGNWSCKCEALQGIEHLRHTCRVAVFLLIVREAKLSEVSCPACGEANRNTVPVCEECSEPVGMKFKYTMEECQARGMSFNVPLKVTVHLVVYDKDPETGAKSIRDIKEQEVYFGEVPMLTDNGTFVINGTERVIVSQLHRSPGVFFQASPDRVSYMAKRVIPYRGAWVEFEFDAKRVCTSGSTASASSWGTVFSALWGWPPWGNPARLYADEVLLEPSRVLWGWARELMGRKACEEVKGAR